MSHSDVRRFSLFPVAQESGHKGSEEQWSSDTGQ